MKNLTKKLLFLSTIFKITSAYLQNIIWENREISNEDVQNTIRRSLDCPFYHYSPFTTLQHLDLIIPNKDKLKEGDVGTLHYQTEGTTHVKLTILKFNNRIEIIEEKLYEMRAIEEEEKENYMKEGKNTVPGQKRKRATVLNEEPSVSVQSFEKLLERLTPFATYWRSNNGEIFKEINTNYSRPTNIAAYNSILDIIHVVSEDGTLDERSFICRTCEREDHIVTFKSRRNNFVQTTVLYKDGAWFHANSINDIKKRRIIMGFHNHENDSNQSYESSTRVNKFIYNGNELTVESGLFTFNEAIFNINGHEYMGGTEGGYIGNYVKIQYTLTNGCTHLKLFRNYGVIILEDAILVNSYYPCKRDPEFYNWLSNFFEKIQDNQLERDGNYGFLVYTTPDGETYRSSRKELIDHFVNNEDDQLFHNCCVASFTGTINNKLITIRKNYGIIENRKLIREHENIINHKTAIQYAPDYSVNIKWSKLI